MSSQSVGIKSIKLSTHFLERIRAWSCVNGMDEYEFESQEQRLDNLFVVKLH